jgi:hypothetical protein
MEAKAVRHRHCLRQQGAVSRRERFEVVYEELENKHSLYTLKRVSHSSAMLFQAVQGSSEVHRGSSQPFLENREDHIETPLERL